MIVTELTGTKERHFCAKLPYELDNLLVVGGNNNVSKQP
jgi:hypothetical protein